MKIEISTILFNGAAYGIGVIDEVVFYEPKPVSVHPKVMHMKTDAEVLAKRIRNDNYMRQKSS